MKTQTEHLRDIEITEDSLEIRMPLTPNEMILGLNPYYQIRAVRPNSYNEIARVGNLSMRIGGFPIMYKICNYLPFSGGRPKIVGLAFTLKSGDEKAHKEALSFANSLSKSNRNIPVKDLSREDKTKLVDVLEKIKRESGEQ